MILRALWEDLGRGDVTSRALVPTSARIQARIIAKASGIVAGTQVARWVFEAVDRRIRCKLLRRDGQPVRRGQTIMKFQGPAHGILAAERTALNFLAHLSGVATLTSQFVRQARPSRAKIMDTRKTLPGLRVFEKYAVRVGGGSNHRWGLDDAVLIKTNHLHALEHRKWGMGNVNCGLVIQEAIARAKRITPKKFVEIEVANLYEFKVALEAQPDAILLDNWSLGNIRKAVHVRNSTFHIPHSTLPLLEVSGGVTLANVRAIVKTGVDRISIGRLTHSAPALDVSLEVI
jgi:nicotinate-nucleotide pyrophosphorylase (carboxylating)